MKQGYLSEYFEGVAAKRLSAVEADETRSNQHEYNATKAMLAFMGRPSGKMRLPTRYIYLSDRDQEPVFEDSFLTLYDSRENHPTRSEYRFYFPTTKVSQLAAAGDFLAIAKCRDGKTLVIIAEEGSSASSQIEWLFGLSSEQLTAFSVRANLEDDKDRINLASTFILESIGMAIEPTEPEWLDLVLDRFGAEFPKTLDFSKFARETLAHMDPRDDPDATLIAWMEREETLFRAMERHLIADRLAQGFINDGKVDVDGFLGFSLSVQNRRKSRVGLALEHHLAHLFEILKISYSRGKITERHSKPDFLFPCVENYHDPAFNIKKLTMLGVKSTCKDRWRQILSEADKVGKKHLLTLEAGISASQTDEMRSQGVQLVLPRSLHGSYNTAQQAWLQDIRSFTELVIARQC